MHAISVKYLRNKLPFVRSRLKKGDSFLIIYNSAPIAKLIPANGEVTFSQDIEEASDEDWQNASLKDMCDDLDEPSKEEIAYYKSIIKKNKHGNR